MCAAAFVPAETTLRMSELTINGEITMKVDALARIDLYGFWYYTIFRRYNSVYDILVEDIHKNVVLVEKSTTTMRQIITQLHNLDHISSNMIYIANNHSMEHSCSSQEITLTALDRPLLEIQRLYTGLYLNLEGIPPANTPEIVISHPVLSLQIPKSDSDEFYQSPSDYNDLSMRVADMIARSYNSVEEMNELMEGNTSLTSAHMLLRSGRRVYKA